MRILVLNWQDRENPRAGGAEIHLHETFGRLARRPGWDVTVVTSGWAGAPSEVELDGMRVVRAGGRHSYLVAVLPAVRRLVAEGARYDVVVEDLNKVPVFAPRWAPAPVLLLVHHLFGATAFREASVPLAAATWLLERPLGVLYQGLPVVAVSHSTRLDLVARGLDEERIEVIPNGIDLDHYTPGPGGVGGSRFPEPTILYLGRLKRYKRVDLLLQAMALLRDRGVAARLLVAGKGDHQGALVARARRLGLGPDRVHFAGFVPEDEKLRLLRGAWVHALTSPREGWGISNLEAAACGTPTVASDAPGLRDSVRHGATGYLVPHGRVPALADRLEALLSDPDLRASLGAGARAFAEGYAWDRSADAMALALRRTAR